MCRNRLFLVCVIILMVLSVVGCANTKGSFDLTGTLLMQGDDEEGKQKKYEYNLETNEIKFYDSHKIGTDAVYKYNDTSTIYSATGPYLSKFDCKTQEKTYFLNSENVHNGIQTVPGRENIISLSVNYKKISLCNVDTLEFEDVVDCGDTIHTWTTDHDLYYSDQDHIYHLDTITKTKTKISTGRYPVVRDGIMAYEEQGVKVRDLQTGEVFSYNDGNNIGHHKLSPDGRYVIFDQQGPWYSREIVVWDYRQDKVKILKDSILSKADQCIAWIE